MLISNAVSAKAVMTATWSEQAYPKLIHYNRLDKGGHFAAWEQPKLFSEEVRAGFRSLRA
jgi:pimeloyl-ACP methyl ester carboxylesterase